MGPIVILRYINDLLNKVYLHIFYHFIPKISEIETNVIGQSTGVGANQKLIIFLQEIYCKSMSNTHLSYIQVW